MKRHVPFLCLYYFGHCKGGVEYGSNGNECLEDNVCKSEWQRGNILLGSNLFHTVSSSVSNGLMCSTDGSEPAICENECVCMCIPT